MIVLHQFDSVFGLPNASPFCMKLETFLKMSGLSYRVEPVRDPGATPKGKAPFVELDGEPIGDSGLIVRRLEERYGIDLDRGLTPGERAAAHAFCVMLEERTYFALLHERWIDEGNWPIVRDAYLRDLPPPVQDQVRERTRGDGSTALRSIVGHHPLDRDPEAGEPGQRPPEEGHRTRLALVGQDLAVGEARRIVDADMQEVPATAALLAAPVAGDRLWRRQAPAPTETNDRVAVDARPRRSARAS
ncbi:MAG: Tom37 metaxin N-terminal-like domain-containing protein [Geminicoccaceae bacterium]